MARIMTLDNRMSQVLYPQLAARAQLCGSIILVDPISNRDDDSVRLRPSCETLRNYDSLTTACGCYFSFAIHHSDLSCNIYSILQYLLRQPKRTGLLPSRMERRFCTARLDPSLFPQLWNCKTTLRPCWSMVWKGFPSYTSREWYVSYA